MRRLIQLNWLTNKVYLFSKGDLTQRSEAATPLKDGWGVTHNGSALVVSDGSAMLHWLDPESLKLLHSLEVKTSAQHACVLLHPDPDPAIFLEHHAQALVVSKGSNVLPGWTQSCSSCCTPWR